MVTPGSASAAATLNVAPAADAAVNHKSPSVRYGSHKWLRVQGRSWRSYMRFNVRGVQGSITRATLVLRTRGKLKAPLQVRVALSHDWQESRIDGRRAPRVGARVATVRRAATCSARTKLCTVKVNVTAAVRSNGVHSFVLTTTSGKPVRIYSREVRSARPRLVIRTSSTAASNTAGARAGAPFAVAGIWTTAEELRAKPMSGAAWNAVKKAADGSLGTANIADQDSDHDVNTLAAALVYARTGVASYRSKVASAIASAIGTEQGGRTLALGRNLASYVIAADLIGLGGLDPALDARFRSWLSAVRHARLDGLTLIETHEKRPNNWGTMAGATRAAIDVYIGDATDLERAFKVFAGWAGDRSAYAGFNFGDLDWQVDPSKPVGVLPAGATKGGLLVDGALPEELRRGGPFQVPPAKTNYAWEALQGAMVQAMIFSRRGYDAWNVQDQAMLRAVSFLDRLERQFGGWWAASDDEWQPYIINHVYGTKLPTRAAGGPGKVMGWTDWTLG